MSDPMENIEDYEFAVTEYYCTKFSRSCYQDGYCGTCSDLESWFAEGNEYESKNL